MVVTGVITACSRSGARAEGPGKSHAGVIGPYMSDMIHWIEDRFANQVAPDPHAPGNVPGVQNGRTGRAYGRRTGAELLSLRRILRRECRGIQGL